MPDSLAGKDQLFESYESLRQNLARYSSHPLCLPSYLGRPLDWLWREPRPTFRSPFNKSLTLQGLVETEEAAINPHLLGACLSQILVSHPLIDLRCGVRVNSVERHQGGFRLHLQDHSGSTTDQADLVANCTWTDRSRLDDMIGMPDSALTTCYRVKHSITVSPTSSQELLAPITMVQGPYGDIVPRQNGQVYLSWYPECRTWFGQSPPEHSLEDPDLAMQVARRSVEAMQSFVPSLQNAQIISSQAGVIMARGTTDIEDPHSQLHRRKHFGATSQQGWWSIDTGKLTSAPMLAEQTAIEMSQAIS